MSEFRDDQMEKLFGTGAGSGPDVDAAYERVANRVRAVRRRRAVVAGGALCTLLVGVAALTIVRQVEPQRLQPGNLDSTRHDSTSHGSTVFDDGSVHAESTTVDTALPATTTVTATTTAPATSATSTGPTVTAAIPPGQTSAPATQPGATVVASTEPSDTAPSPTPITQTFFGVGGRITVRLENDSLALVSFQAADGFTAEVNHSSGSHVEVRFTSATHETIARVDYEDGAMVQRFEEVDT